MNRSVVKLGRFGYQRDEIADMPLSLFVLILDAVEQVSAEDRLAFVTDMSAVTSGLFAAKGKNPLGQHVKLLQDAIKGN